MSPSTDVVPASEGISEDRQRRVAALAVVVAREMNVGAELISGFHAGLIANGELRLCDERIQAAVEIADRVDAALQGTGNDERSLGDLLAECWSGTERGSTRFHCLSALDRIYERYSPLVFKTPPRLGVCPAVMAKALSLFSKEEVTLNEIENVAGCDPILATSLLRYANSALFDRGCAVTTTKAAVARIGFTAARKVIMAASARPLFQSATLSGLWQHSVDVASIAQEIAARTEKADPSEAFIAGLTHDLGRIAIEMVDDADYLALHRRLTAESGCPILADFVVNGQDHGQIGAAILTIWRMPETLVDTLRHHHRPELGRSPMASIVYLSECVSESHEDIAVPSRLEGALAAVGLTSLDSVASDVQRLSTALSTLG